jgi:hypothetical protein
MPDPTRKKENLLIQTKPSRRKLLDEPQAGEKEK